MVGVAGKSKACLTCRKRKIKCDLSTPTCGQCARGSWKCEVYSKPVVFLNQYSATYEKSPTRLPSLRKGLPNAYENTRPLTSSKSVQTGDGLSNMQSFAHVINSAQYNQLLSSFVTFCLPKQTSEDVPLAWLSSLAKESRKSDILLLATASLGFGWMGHMENRPDVLKNGLIFYGRALEHLRAILSRRQPKLSPDLLPTIMMLLLYEIFEFGTQSSVGWISHTSGIETVLQLRGPHSFNDGLDFQMFHFYRTVGILKGLTIRKSCFLSKPKWVSTWLPGRMKSRFDGLLDLAAEAPNLLEMADNAPIHATYQHYKLVRRILNLIHDLTIWEISKNIQLPQGPPHAFSASNGSMMTTDQLQPRVHRYPSKDPQSLGIAFDELQPARWILFYWTVVLTLYTTIYDKPYLSSCLWDDRILQLQTSIKLSVLEADILAEKITVWADFCSQNAWQSFGPAIAIASIKAAIKWYHVRQREQQANLLPISSRCQLEKCHAQLAHMTYCDRIS
ncbi:hypothetical protein BGW36DRAFT_384377 [Talaromyces proteolyticus]|uniref:Zn(2)-C6 fungal-type domain-containing protein n=1 Tax=Talaromyces proteolyticus TaxID=1131652 RepID=A0AAD4PYB7_9EURO|nr:uncharacterized protein BGW36DRAFT_384377 [Talaromyces proteolyticus]KAH8694104.1 hypothetical protein BGW36DRAFT_384377 [Talaromyces proteolyticus]